VITVTEREIVTVLRDFGLTEKEAEVYMFLAKTGVQKAGEVSARLRMHKAQVYRILEVLRNRGFVEETLDFPSLFVPISFEHFLEMAIKTKKEETLQLESRKSKLLTAWRSLESEKPLPQQAKFTVVKGREKIYSRILQLVEGAKNEVLAMTDSIGIIRSEQAGIFDLTKKKDASFKILTNVSKENYRFIKTVLQKTLQRRFQIEGRHKDLGAKPYPRFVIKDDEEIVFFLTQEESSASGHSDTMLWTNNGEIVSALKIFFKTCWEEATDLGIRISELETGAAISETVIMRDPKIAYKRFYDVIKQTKTGITAISTSKELTKILMECMVPLSAERSLVTHIMVSLDMDNLEIAEKMSSQLQVKYAGSVQLDTAIIDGKYLFMFKTPLIGGRKGRSSYFEQMLYTNDAGYVQSIRSVLEDLWYKAPFVSDLEVSAAMRSPPVTVSVGDSALRVVEVMRSNNIGSVVVEDNEKPIGIITEKDVLGRAVGNSLDLQKTVAEEIMSRPLITISKGSNLLEALRLMKTQQIRRLVVMEETKLIGVLSERRILEKSEAKLMQEITKNKSD
jgi:sugar-specific transcriptional regulator TrmB/CBS domain-containing protein